MSARTAVLASALLAGLVSAGASRAAAQAQPLGIDSSYGCVVCHIDHRRAFLSGVHAERGIRCADCHGGNPNALAVPAAHAGRFLGRPTKRQTFDTIVATTLNPWRCTIMKSAM